MRPLFGKITVAGKRAAIKAKPYRKLIVGTSTLLIVALVVQTAFFNDVPEAQAALTTIRQEVNITNGYLAAASGTYATSSEVVSIDPSKYSGATYYLEVVASTTAATNATVSLVNAATGAVARSVTVNGTGYDRYRSTSFTPGATTEYRVRLGNEAVGKGVIAARIVILQDSGAITSTQTQIEIGNKQTYTSGTLSPLTAPKYWKYNSANWDGSPTFYAEATYARTVDVTVASSTTFTTSGSRSFTVPSNIASTTVVQLWGGGGGGGAASTNSTGAGSGGGGGQYARSVIGGLAGLTKTVVVATGGPGGVGTVAGTAGANSTWDSTVVVAAGGGGGGANQGTAGSGSGFGAGDVQYNGGNGAVGVSGASSGGGGEGGRSNGAGGNASGGTGGTGGDGGDGGAGRTTDGIGNAGSAPGGGGAGARSTGNPNRDGGAGAIGQAVISYNLAASATTTIVLQESDGTGDGFAGWTDKITIVSGGSASTPTRVRSGSFTPVNGRNYRIAVREGYNGATHAIYNAKIVVDQVTAAAISYPVSNQDGAANIFGDPGGNYKAQTFTSTGGTLASVELLLSKDPSVSGNAYLRLYAVSGTVGSTAVPTGTALAESDPIDVSALTGSLVLTNVTFTGSNRYVMTNGVGYALALEYDSGDLIEGINVGTDGSSPSFGGNLATFSGSWSADSTKDMIFYLYTTAAAGIEKLESQYLLANRTLFSGTGLQKYHTYFDTAEWGGSVNTYSHQVDAANGSASVVEINTEGGTQVTGSVVTSPDNSGVSSSMTMPATGDLDVKATTNNSDVYASKIIVAVTPDVTAPTPNPYFTTAPNATTTNMVNMTSVTITDANAVSYYFNPVAGSCGGNAGTGTTTSGWQSSPTYYDVGLQINKCYAYTVTGKDAANNVTLTSSASTTYTRAAVPGGPTYSAVGVTSITFSNTENGNPASNPTTNFVVRASSTDSGWNNRYLTGTTPATSTTPVWLTDAQLDNLVLNNLRPNTRYDFESVARNQNQVLTATSTRTGATTLADTSAPTPNPATFSSAPNNVSGTQINMTATAGSDVSTPISYFFDHVACSSNPGNNGTDSGWQTSTSYSDTGLDVNRCYGYTIQSRDAVPNTGTASGVTEVYTTANTPSAPTLGSAGETTFIITNNENGNPSNTQFAAQVVGTSPSDITWQNQYINTDGTPSASAIWMSDATMTNLTVTGLDFATQYTVRVMARNGDNEVTASSTSANITTNTDGTAPTPNPTFSSAPNNDSVSQISMTSNSVSDPSTPISYYFTAVVGSCGANWGTGYTDSGWQSNDTTYSDDSLQTNRCYSYTVTARDVNSNTTSASAASQAYTSAAVPGQVTQVTITDEAITINNTENGNPALNPTTQFAVLVTSSDGTWNNQYVNGSGSPSGSAVWLTDAQLDGITVTGLLQSTSYTFAVKARNGDLDETAFGATQTLSTVATEYPETRIQGGVRLQGIRVQ